MELLKFTPKHSPQEKPTFEQVYTRYYSNILSYIRLKVDNQQDAEDLCSEAFLYCYDQYENYDPEKSSISTWLYLVVNSRIKNYYRDHKSHADIDDFSNVIPDEGDDMDRSIYLEQLRDTLGKAIATLPEKQQKIVILRYFKQMSSAEIADQLGLTPGNVRVLLTRALDKLEISCASLKF